MCLNYTDNGPHFYCTPSTSLITCFDFDTFVILMMCLNYTDNVRHFYCTPSTSLITCFDFDTFVILIMCLNFTHNVPPSLSMPPCLHFTAHSRFYCTLFIQGVAKRVKYVLRLSRLLLLSFRGGTTVINVCNSWACKESWSKPLIKFVSCFLYSESYVARNGVNVPHDQWLIFPDQIKIEVIKWSQTTA